MIRIENCSFQYKGSAAFALKEISLTIQAGEFVGILGNNGAGKSTLCYALSGIVPHYYPGDFYGSVQVDGLDTVDEKPETLGLVVGSVFQDVDGQMVCPVVEDEILFGLENFGVPKDQIEGRVADALEAVGISELRERNLDSLSGGQKQKVAIAAIVALRPKVMILDEPTGEMDPQSSMQVYELLEKLRLTYGITIIAVEQKPLLLANYAKRLLLLNEGELLLDGTALELFERKDLWEQIDSELPKYLQLGHNLRDKKMYQGALPYTLAGTKQMVQEVCTNAAL